MDQIGEWAEKQVQSVVERVLDGTADVANPVSAALISRIIAIEAFLDVTEQIGARSTDRGTPSGAHIARVEKEAAELRNLLRTYDPAAWDAWQAGMAPDAQAAEDGHRAARFEQAAREDMENRGGGG